MPDNFSQAKTLRTKRRFDEENSQINSRKRQICQLCRWDEPLRRRVCVRVCEDTSTWRLSSTGARNFSARPAVREETFRIVCKQIFHHFRCFLWFCCCFLFPQHLIYSVIYNLPPPRFRHLISCKSLAACVRSAKFSQSAAIARRSKAKLPSPSFHKTRP